MPLTPDQRWPRVVRDYFDALNADIAAKKHDQLVLKLDRLELLLDELEETIVDPPMRVRAAFSFFDSAYYFAFAGDRLRAINCLKNAVEHWNTILEEHPDHFLSQAGRAAANLEIGSNYAATGEAAKAEEHYQLAIDERTKLFEYAQDHPEAMDNATQLCVAHYRLGLLYRERGHFQEAKKIFAQVEANLRKMIPSPRDETTLIAQEHQLQQWFDLYKTPHWITIAQHLQRTLRAHKEEQ